MRYLALKRKVAICPNVHGGEINSYFLRRNRLGGAYDIQLRRKDTVQSMKTENTMFKETMTAFAIVAGLVATSAQAKEGGDKMEARFTQMDVDGDGQVTVAELEARAAARFAETDTNGDGVLSKAEALAAAETREAKRLAKRVEKRFERMDADKDGNLTKEEAQGRRDPAKMIAKLDTDKSGGVSLEEFAKARHHGKGKGHGKDKRHGEGKHKTDAEKAD